MKQSDLAVILGGMQEEIDKLIHEATINLQGEFITSATTNEQAMFEADMHFYMVNYLIYSALNSKYKKLFDTGKRAMDTGVIAIHQDEHASDSVANQTRTLHQNNVFVFTKRQNKDGETTLVTDLVTALARAGVEKAVVDAAIKQATKPKKGNTYYDVKVVE